ncbi:MAG TPA: TetR/AcrR family transcriptional regulator [Mycobacterium sp.]|nr:TetR/AcrR family transcriptional regulator [Mycobacterium sp.]
MSIYTPRKRDGDQRRRELCDAAIRVLAEHGSRGLTHGQVDRYARVPDGSTSYYYRTRAALLRGVGKRVAEIDVANLQSVSAQPLDPRSPFAHLARLTLMQADGEGLMLNRARHELLLNAARDPDLAELSQESVGRIITMAQDAIAHLQPDVDDPALLEAQTTAVTTFLAGVLTRLVAGDRTIDDADQLARLLHTVATAVSLARSAAQ